MEAASLDNGRLIEGIWKLIWLPRKKSEFARLKFLEMKHCRLGINHALLVDNVHVQMEFLVKFHLML